MSKSRNPYAGRRLQAPPLPEIALTSRKPEQICLTIAVVLMFALFGFIWYTGSAVLYIHDWVYVVVVSLIVIALLGAGAFAIYRNTKTDRARRNATIALPGVMIMFLAVALVICVSYSTLEQPVGFYDSPEKENRIVVMRTRYDEGVLITAYPAIGNHFYIPVIKSEVIHSNGVIQGVEWEGERLAKVILCDINGNDTVLPVDFSLLYAEDSAE